MATPRPRTGTLARHLSYANVVSTLALLFAMTGGALAASHYVISSTKQIKPSVLKKLTPKAAKAYSAGSGLVLAGHQFSLSPGAIPIVPAAFPGSSCASGSLLDAVTASGAASCTSNHAYSASSGSQSLTGDQASSVQLPAGNWVLIGTAIGVDSVEGSMVCKLNVGGAAIDESDGVTQPDSTGSPYVSLSLLGTTTTSGSSTTVETYCTGTGAVEMRDINLVAIPVAALN